MTHRSGGPQAKTVGYLKPKEKKPTRPEESLALQGLVHLSCWQLNIDDSLIEILSPWCSCCCLEIEDDFAEIEEIWNEPEPDFVCVIIPEVFLLDNPRLCHHYNHHHLHHYNHPYPEIKWAWTPLCLSDHPRDLCLQQPLNVSTLQSSPSAQSHSPYPDMEWAWTPLCLSDNPWGICLRHPTSSPSQPSTPEPLSSYFFLEFRKTKVFPGTWTFASLVSSTWWH